MQEIFFSHWPVLLFTVKAVQEFFFSNLLPSPPSKVKWSAPKSHFCKSIKLENEAEKMHKIMETVFFSATRFFLYKNKL